MKILIVDDEEPERGHLISILENAGHEAIGAEDGEVGFNSWKENEIDLTITDYRMPKVNGLDLLAQIKTENPEGRVWLVSNWIVPDIVKQAYSLGAEKVIWKTNVEHELHNAGLLR
jgi:YesN/AraC family two-component response regulator